MHVILEWTRQTFMKRVRGQVRVVYSQVSSSYRSTMSVVQLLGWHQY